MLNKEEKDILLKYPTFQEIDVTDYLADFVMNNIDNFPISSLILAHMYKPEKSIKENISRDILKDTLIRDLIDRYSESVRFENCMNFTSALIIFCSRRKRNPSVNKMTILNKNDNDITVCLKGHYWDYSLVFNSNYDKDLIMVHDNQMPLFLNYIDSVNFDDFNDMIDKNSIPCDYYRFPININTTSNRSEKEMYFDRFEMFMRYITGESHKHINVIDGSNPYCKNDDVVDNNIMYVMNNYTLSEPNSFIEKCFVKCNKLQHNEKIKHLSEFSNKDFTEKQVSNQYQ